MKLWKWFCRLGIAENKIKPVAFWKQKNNKAEQQPIDGTEEICTRMCGKGGCQCGSTVRGLHCIWSYYRRA